MAPQAASHFSVNALYDVSGLVALVTGGGTGIGLMIAQGLASNGSKVYISGRRKDVLEKQEGEYGSGRIVASEMDVTNKDSILAARKIIEEKDGRLDILVNNAGQSGPLSPFIYARQTHLDAESFGDGLFAAESFEDWATHWQVNVASIHFVSSAFLGLLAKGAAASDKNKKIRTSSSIINITSISGSVKLAQDHFCYNSAKAAATHLTKMMATELSLRKLPIRVNSIAPGVYSTEMTHYEPANDQPTTDAIGKPLIPVPAERGGSEAEMAATAILLASSGGGYIHGQEIVVDGGYLAVNPSTV